MKRERLSPTHEIEELLRRNVDTFSQRDPVLRQAAIAETYCEDIVFADPMGTVTGHEALNAKIEHLLLGIATLDFVPQPPAYEAGNLGAIAWALAAAEDRPVTRGLDVIEVHEGRIHRLTVLLVREAVKGETAF